MSRNSHSQVVITDHPISSSNDRLRSSLSLIPLQLRHPVISVRRRNPHPTAASVIMPETPIHEHYLPARRKHQIRTPGQIRPMQPVAIPQPMKQPTHLHLRLHPLRFHPRHYPAADFRRYCVHHISAPARGMSPNHHCTRHSQAPARDSAAEAFELQTSGRSHSLPG